CRTKHCWVGTPRRAVGSHAIAALCLGFSLPRDDERAQLKRAAPIRLAPKKIIRSGQHFGNLELDPLRKPSVKNFEEQIALKIDKYRFRIFVARLGPAAAQRLLGRADVDEPRQVPFRSQPLDREHKIARNARIITWANFI